MIYLIGGPGRSGKTTLAMRLNAGRGIPYFSLDYLMMGLYHGAPGLRVDPNRPEAEAAPRIWPVALPMITAMLENGEDYCVEGFPITPLRIVPLIERFPGTVKACFMGYLTATPKEMLHRERNHHTTNSWSGVSDDRAIREFQTFRETSIRLKQECDVHGRAFFDTSKDFSEAITEALGYLIGK